MKLGTTAKQIVITIIALFAIAVAGLIGVGHNGGVSASENGPLEKALHGISANGLTATGIAFADVYGENNVAAAVACPGETTGAISSRLGVDVSGMRLGINGVPANYNYLIVADQEGNLTFDRMSIDDVDLCSAQAQSQSGGTYRAYDIVPFVQNPESGAWVLAA